MSRAEAGSAVPYIPGAREQWPRNREGLGSPAKECFKLLQDDNTLLGPIVEIRTFRQGGIPVRQEPSISKGILERRCEVFDRRE